MNCDDYRQSIAAQPTQSEDWAAHVAVCENCAEFRAEMLALDEKIKSALQIDVPDIRIPELPEITVDQNDGASNVVTLPKRRSIARSLPAWVGLAASLAVAGILGTRYLVDDTDHLSLADEIVAHLDHEPGALRVTNTPVSERNFASVVRANAVDVDRDMGLITYARSCTINGKKIPHLVMQGERGPITLLLLPDEAIDAAVELMGDGINGILLPFGDKGSIAIIGERGERLDEVEERVLNSVKWRT